MRNKKESLFNVWWPLFGIVFTSMAIGFNLHAKNAWVVAIDVVLFLICFGVMTERMLEKGDSDK